MAISLAYIITVTRRTIHIGIVLCVYCTYRYILYVRGREKVENQCVCVCVHERTHTYKNRKHTHESNVIH